MNSIEIGGKKRPVFFNRRALVALEAEWNLSGLQELGKRVENLSTNDLTFLTFVGLREGARRAKDDTDITLEMVEDWMDEEPIGSFMLPIMELFGNNVNSAVEEEKKTTAKGKATK